MSNKIKNRERMMYIALCAALLVMLALGGAYAQGANVQDLDDGGLDGLSHLRSVT